MEDFIKNLSKKYRTDSFFLMLPAIISTLIALITLPIILRNLPVENYGIFQFILALQIWLIVFTGSHITSGSTRGITKGFNGTFLFAFLSRFKLSIITGSVMLIVSLYFYFINSYIFFFLLVIFSIYLIFGYLFQPTYTQFFIAKKQFKNLAVWQITTSLIVSISSALTTYFTHNIVIFALVQLGLGFFISLIAWLYVIKKNNLLSAYKKGEIDEECVLYGLKLIPVDLISVTAGKISHFIIGPFLDFQI